jgi:hypothetical protein
MLSNGVSDSANTRFRTKCLVNIHFLFARLFVCTVIPREITNVRTLIEYLRFVCFNLEQMFARQKIQKFNNKKSSFIIIIIIIETSALTSRPQSTPTATLTTIQVFYCNVAK